MNKHTHKNSYFGIWMYILEEANQSLLTSHNYSYSLTPLNTKQNFFIIFRPKLLSLSYYIFIPLDARLFSSPAGT